MIQQSNAGSWTYHLSCLGLYQVIINSLFNPIYKLIDTL